MLTVKDINLTTERYGDGYECVVNFQVGDQIYNTVKVKLPPAATREIVDLTIKRATETVAVVGSTVPVAGEALPLIEPDLPEDPDFAEVDEFTPVPCPVPADDYSPTAQESF